MSGSVDTATLQLTVDTTSVDKGKQSLADFQAQAALTETAVNASNAKIASGFDAIKQSTSGTAQAYQSLSDQIAATNQANADREVADAAKLQQIQVQNYKQMFDEIAAAEKAAAAQRAADALAAEQASDDAILAARIANQAKLDAIRAAEGPGGFSNTNAIKGQTAQEALASRPAVAPVTPVTTDEQHQIDLAADSYKAEAQAAALAAAGITGVGTTAEQAAVKAESLTEESEKVAASFTLNARQTREFGSALDGLVTGNMERAELSTLSFGNSFGLLGKLFSPTGLAIGLTAAAIVGLTAATVEGERSVNEYNASLALTGNAAQLSYGQLENMAKSIATGGTTYGEAIDTLTKLAETGKYTASEIQEIGSAATQVADRTGQSIDSIVGQFAKLAEDPSKNILDLNTNLGFLTTSEYAYIKSLQDTGNEQAAATEAIKDYADAVKAALDDEPDKIGTVESAWRSLKNTISDTVQAVKDYGRNDLDGQIAALQKQNDTLTTALQKGQSGNRTGQFFSAVGGILGGDVTPDQYSNDFQSLGSDSSIQAKIDANNAQIASLTAQNDAKKQLNSTTTTENQLNADGVKSYSDLQATAEQYNKSLKETNELARAYNQWQGSLNSKTTDPKQAEALYNQAVAGITSRYKGQNTQKAQQGLDEAPDAAALKQAAADEAATFAQLKSLRDSDSIDSLTYYKDQVDAINTWEGATVAAYAKEYDAVQANMGTGAQEIESKKKLIQITEDEAAAKTKASQQISEASAVYVKSIIAEETEITKYAAAQDKSLRDQQQKNSDTEYTAGLGGDAATNASAILAINNKLASDLESIDAKYGANKDGFYDQDVAKAKQTNAEKLADEQQHEQKMQAINASYTVGIEKGYQDFLKTAGDVAGQTANITNSALTGIASNFAQLAVTGKANWKDLTTSILEDIIKMEVQAEEAKALQSLANAGNGGGIGGFFSGLIGKSGAVGSSDAADVAGGTAIGAPPAFGLLGAGAKGLIADQGNIVPMRNGGIIDSATMFPMANGGTVLGGEAGPEGIVPLKRTSDGRLGVASTGGGGSPVQQNVSIEVHNYGQDQATVTQSGDDSNKVVKLVIGAVAQDIATGGKVHKAISTKYNVNQKGQRF